MKLNVSASELAESLKLKTNENSASTELSNLIDDCDSKMGYFLGYAEDFFGLTEMGERYENAVEAMDKLMEYFEHA